MNHIQTKYRELSNTNSADVDPSVYTSSVFESQEGFLSAIKEFQNVIFGTIKEDLRDKPLIYKRNAIERLLSSLPKKGIDFGAEFEHKFTREPIFTFVVSKDNGWVYESSSKQDDGTYNERTVSLTVTTKEDLMNAVISELSTDLTYYAGKRLTFK